jgi:lipopolysaccharide transport system ATP-binding protein
MSEVALKIENLYKQYQLGVVGTGTLSHDINRLWAKLRGKEDPYSVITVKNNREEKQRSDYVWALNDVNLEINKGDLVGLIGKNGAGKSTLLKIISRITKPTKGNIYINGRIGALLEVGTGFHPELTGRQNVYLNGAILGMKKSEISAKLDEIVEFSGVAGYIDTPVKRYSSGMKVRLGFAVAAFLEPEILIVDEVLAVGDYEFQKKCLARMQEVAKEGTTVIFVSHNIDFINRLTKKCALIENGTIVNFDETQKVIEQYYGDDKPVLKYEAQNTNRKVYYKGIELNDTQLDLTVVVKEKRRFCLSFEICSSLGAKIYTMRDIDTEIDYLKDAGVYHFSVDIKSDMLMPGQYYINFALADLGVERLDYVEKGIKFEIVSNKNLKDVSTRAGFLYIKTDWDLKIERENHNMEIN